MPIVILFHLLDESFLVLVVLLVPVLLHCLEEDAEVADAAVQAPDVPALALLVGVLLDPLVVNSSLKMVSLLDGQARVCV